MPFQKATRNLVDQITGPFFNLQILKGFHVLHNWTKILVALKRLQHNHEKTSLIFFIHCVLSLVWFLSNVLFRQYIFWIFLNIHLKYITQRYSRHSNIKRFTAESLIFLCISRVARISYDFTLLLMNFCVRKKDLHNLKKSF